MANLIVKGSVEQVQLALEARGIAWNDIVPHEKFVECSVYCYAGTSFSTLSQWFCEDRPCEHGVGFPPGTLLWYGPS